LVDTIRQIVFECLCKWGPWEFHKSGIYTPFYQKMIEACNSVSYPDVRAGGTLHFDWDRTKTDIKRTKRISEEAYDLWFNLSEDQRRGFSEIEELVEQMHAVPDNNPPGTTASSPRDNPDTRHHPLHFGPGRNPQDAQLVSLMTRVQHSMR
jgi:hypothetical protein